MAANDSFSDDLQCPVCLLVPRDVPIPACPVGHLVCQSCRVNVHTCPTCRRPMHQGGTNTLANKMIEEIPHPCKYSQFGCKIKRCFIELEEHEERCPERTIKCPYLRCKEVIQIKKYHEHAMNSECSRSHSNNRQTNFSYIGKSASRVDLFWSVKPYEDHGKTFYLHHYFFPVSELLPFTSL